MSTPTVRAITPADQSDVDEIDQLTTNALRRVYRPTDEALAHRARITRRLSSLVAVADDRVVGVVRYYRNQDRLAFLGLAVHPLSQRRGVARALIRELEDIARTTGCADLVLHTVRETGNVEVFTRLGFLVESEQDTRLFQSETGLPLTEVVMKKDVRLASDSSSGGGRGECYLNVSASRRREDHEGGPS